MDDTTLTDETRQALPEDVLGRVTHRALVVERAADGTTATSTDEQGRRIYWALAYAAGQVDSYGTTLTVDATKDVTVEDFRILVNHDRKADPVGKPVVLEHSPQGLKVGWVFAETDRAQEVERLVADHMYRAVSIGFEPLDGYVRQDDDVVVFTAIRLHELSLVNCPSSTGAKVDLSRAMGEDVADLEPFFRSLEEFEAEASAPDPDAERIAARAVERAAQERAFVLVDGSLEQRIAAVRDAVRSYAAERYGELDPWAYLEATYMDSCVATIEHYDLESGSYTEEQLRFPYELDGLTAVLAEPTPVALVGVVVERSDDVPPVAEVAATVPHQRQLRYLTWLQQTA